MLNKQFLTPIYEKTNKFKNIILYVICGLILLGILITSIFGFNKNIELTGGHIVSITLGEDIENNSKYSDAVNYLKKELGKNGLNFYSAQRQNEGVETTIVIKYTGKITTEKTDAFDNVVTAKYGIDATDISDHDDIDAIHSGREVIWTIAGILILTALVAVYMCIRFNFAAAMATIVSMLAVIGLFMALTGITRTLVGTTLFGAILLSAIYALFEGNMFSESIKKLADNEKEEDKQFLVERAIKSNLSRFGIALLFVVIFALLLIIFPPITTLFIGLELVYIVIAMLLSMLYVFPFVYKFALKFVKDKPRKKKEIKSVTVKPTESTEK